MVTLRHSSQDSQTAFGAAQLKAATLYRWPKDQLVRGAATVGRVGEHIMNRQRSTQHNMWRPSLVVRSCRFFAMATVDEQERDRRRPPSCNRRRSPNDCEHNIVQIGVVDGVAKRRQRVHQSGTRINKRSVVVFPTSLVLVAPPMMIHREQHRRARARSRTQPHGAATAVRTNLQKWQTWESIASLDRCCEQRVAFVGGHETFCRQCTSAQPFGQRLIGHGRTLSATMHVPCLRSTTSSPCST